MADKSTYSRWRPHPWHGLETGANAPHVVNAYIEITPFDLMKYEIDKFSGYMVVDRPQRTSSQPPALYGFIPRTYCAARVYSLMKGANRGDNDPLDICVFSERPINRSEVIVEARVIGGIPMIDEGAADDKIITVLENDLAYKNVNEIGDLPEILIERLTHYFMTYKLQPARETDVSVGDAYGREHAEEVIKAAIQDYLENFPSVEIITS